VTNELTLRAHLNEQSDHKLVRIKRTAEGELLSVPLDPRVIIKLLSAIKRLPSEFE